MPRTSAILATTLLLVIPLPAGAEYYADLAHCSAMSDEAERVQCFTKLRQSDPAVDSVIQQMQHDQQAPPARESAETPSKTSQPAENADLAACSEISNSVDRLACFDAATKARGAASPAVATPDVKDSGSWIVTTEVSKVDDSTSVFVKQLSDKPLEDRLGNPMYARLVLRCQENATDAAIWLGGHWYTDRELVTVRVDKRKATKSTWGESTDHEWMFHPSPVAFIRELIGGVELYVETSPINEGPAQMTFNISGLGNAIKPLKKACHWQ